MKTKKGGKAVTVILVIIVCIFALFPFIWMISTSFKTNSEIYTQQHLHSFEASDNGWIYQYVYDRDCYI